MKTLKKRFAKGIHLLLGIGVVVLGWLATAYGGEWEPIITGTVADTLEIAIKNQDFTNQDSGSVSDHFLIVPKGMNVKWINKERLVTVNGDLGLMPHGIQISEESEKEAFTASSILNQEHNNFSYTFSKVGTFSYRCFIHPYMKGKLVVVNMPGR